MRRQYQAHVAHADKHEACALCGYRFGTDDVVYVDPLGTPMCGACLDHDTYRHLDQEGTMQADQSYTAYAEGNGTRYVRDELFEYGAHDWDTGVCTRHIGVRRYSLWVSSQFGDGALTREVVYLDHPDYDRRHTDRCTRDGVAMWLPVVRDGVEFAS